MSASAASAVSQMIRSRQERGARHRTSSLSHSFKQYQPCRYVLVAMITTNLVSALVYYNVASAFYEDRALRRLVPLKSKLFGYKLENDHPLMTALLLTYTTAFSVISSIFGYVATVTARKAFILIYSLLTAISTLMYVRLVPFFAYQWIQLVIGISINFNLAMLLLYLRHQMDATRSLKQKSNNSSSWWNSCSWCCSWCCTGGRGQSDKDKDENESQECCTFVRQLYASLSATLSRWTARLANQISPALFARTQWTLLVLMGTGIGWTVLYSVLHLKQYSICSFRLNATEFFAYKEEEEEGDDNATTNITTTVTPTPKIIPETPATRRMMYTISLLQMVLVTFLEVVATVAGLAGIATGRFTLIGVYARLTLFGAVYVPSATVCAPVWAVMSASLWLPAAVVGAVFAAMQALTDGRDHRQAKEENDHHQKNSPGSTVPPLQISSDGS